jgi:hypothetical protein
VTRSLALAAAVALLVWTLALLVTDTPEPLVRDASHGPATLLNGDGRP